MIVKEPTGGQIQQQTSVLQLVVRRTSFKITPPRGICVQLCARRPYISGICLLANVSTIATGASLVIQVRPLQHRDNVLKSVLVHILGY